MASEALIPNRVRDERLAAGIKTPEELAARAGIDPALYGHIEAGRVLPTVGEMELLTSALGGIKADRLYGLAYLGLIGDEGTGLRGYTPALVFRNSADQEHLLMSRDEVTWFERQPGTDHQADVYMNLSCGTRQTPHLLLDTVAVLHTLDVSFVAAAGPAACCGKPFLNVGRTETGERINREHIDRSVEWGAETHVNWCTACQVTSTTAAARRLYADGEDHPVREVQVLSFLEARVRELGDRMRWKKPVSRRVLVEGHPEISPINRDAQLAAAKLLAMIPGVEVVDLYDGISDDSPCSGRGRDPGWTPPPWYERQNTPEGIRDHRAWLARYAHSRGADTFSCQHQGCHALWSRYASDDLAVCHAVSILAEALDCAHPDRYQAAVRLGDPEEFLSQTRSVWESWGMSEARARKLAVNVSDPKFADPIARWSCGQESFITVDVLTGSLRSE